MASDIIILRELRLDTVIGIYDWERRIRQRLLLDLDMAWDIRPAADADDIDLTLNYKAVADRVCEFAAGADFRLVETLAERIAALVMEEFSVPWVRVHLNKAGAITAAAGVGVVIERGTRR